MTKRPHNIVWHIISNRWNSAITEYALSSARALQLQGWDCRILCLRGSPCEARAKSIGIQTHAFENFSPTSYTQISTPYRAEQPSVIVTYGGPESVLTRLFIDKSKTRYFRFRGDDRKRTGLKARLIYRLSHSKADAVIVPNDELKHWCQKQGSTLVEKVTLGCDTARYSFQKLPAGYQPRNEMLIVGRFDPVKGHREFFTFAADLRKAWRHAENFPVIHIIGQSANVDPGMIDQWAKESGFILGKDYLLSDRYIENLPALMRSAGLGVVCSVGSEQICRVAEEFLLCGCPVLVSGVGGLGEIASKDFGLNYGLLQSDLGIVNDFIFESTREDGVRRAQRATLAQEAFSLDAMGRRLSSILQTRP
jgi:glycosyltransferase involved in cell wall biosynthesis